MAWLCRMCADNAGPSVSLLDTSQRHLQWAINHFGIKLDDVLPTSVCLPCDASILDWTSFLHRREKARSLISTMIANQPQLASKVPPSSVPGTERLHVPRQLTSRPHTSNTSVPSKSSGHCTVSDLSLPQHLVMEYHIKDCTIIMSRLRNQVLESLQQIGTVDCSVVDSQMSEQRNVRIKLEPVAVDPSVCNNQISDNLQQDLSSAEDGDEIEVPFEAIYVFPVKCEPDLVKSETNSDFSADQTENHVAANMTVTVEHEVISNAEEYSDVQPGLPDLETSPEISNPGSNKDLNTVDPVFRCAHCIFMADCKSKIRSHIVKQHVKIPRYQCQECDKSYENKNNLLRHIRHVHPDKCSYKCLLCKQGFQIEKRFNTHIKNHKTLQCDVCGKTLSSKRSLTEHKIRIHTKSSPLSCDMCGKIFYTDTSLKQHRREVHSNLSFQCDICDKSFKTKANLRTHQREVHASLPAISCSQCKKTFVTKFNLKQHSVVHSDLRPFKCEKCGSCFTRSGHLRKHIGTVHSNVRAFKCHLCGKSFKTKGELTQHLNSHSDVHTCGKCGKQFKTKNELIQHLPSHSEIRPFACAQCHKKLKSKADLVRHLLHAHCDVRTSI